MQNFAKVFIAVLCISSVTCYQKNRVVGGVLAALGEFPYQVSILEEGYHFCGGAILDSEWVLTAAHCLCDEKVSNPQAAAGFVNQQNQGSEYQIRNIISTICHGNYNSQLNDNDIALAKVEPGFTLGGNVDKIDLPASSSFIFPEKAIVSGWGATSENGPTAELLYKLEVNVYPWNTCNGIYDDELSDLMICAGYMEGGKDSCQGDSGGPLTCDNGGKPILCAVVAAGDGCARQGLPGLYTPTSKFLDWITANMN